MRAFNLLTKSLLAGTMLTGAAATANAADLGDVEIIPVAPVDHHNISGEIDIGVGYVFADTTDCDNSCYDWGLFSGGGKANLWLSPASSLQLDAWGEAGDGEANFGIGGHLAWRDPNHYALGVFGSLGTASGLGSDFATVGVEGQAYFGNLTVYGQLAYTGGSGDYDGFYAFGEARYFFTPNIMAAGHLAFDIIDGSEGHNGGDFRWGLDLEVKHDNSGLVGFASYQGADAWHNEADAEHAFLVGVKVLFNQPDLLSADRYGATFDDHNPMYGRTRYRNAYD